MPTLRIASAQFSVEADIAQNRDQILQLIRDAADGGARVVHFCETALSGYGGFEVPDTRALDWALLHDATAAICEAAHNTRTWVLLGSTHRLSGEHLPHNSVYVINDQGQVVDRYDKRFCTGTAGGDPTLDHQQYTPGDRACVFELDGVTCGVGICYDYRFPELYRDLKRRGVQLLFQSFHNARRDYQTYRRKNIWRELVPAVMMTHAATNHFWVSAVNSTTRYSLWGSFFVQPDGRVTGKLPVHKTGVLISELNTESEIWDASAPWRNTALEGTLHSGTLVDDPRSKDRNCF
ncbi:MAG: carbon-nitrogen hydrolase family protein [Planctomycetes bacterium]|nr:carbon-nitrogen hydrolase family protein [Planctomycetota bacterium]